jgi:hypothetical protein
MNLDMVTKDNDLKRTRLHDHLTDLFLRMRFIPISNCVIYVLSLRSVAPVVLLSPASTERAGHTPLIRDESMPHPG